MELYGDIECTFNGVKLDVSQVEFGRAILKTHRQSMAGRIEGIGVECTMTFEADGLQAFREIFEPSKPQWGQPGRHRRRKARQAARRLEAWRRAMLARVASQFQLPPSGTADSIMFGLLRRGVPVLDAGAGERPGQVLITLTKPEAEPAARAACWEVLPMTTEPVFRFAV